MQTSYLALKIDLENAYDKLEWNFIRRALEEMKFLEKIY